MRLNQEDGLTPLLKAIVEDRHDLALCDRDSHLVHWAIDVGLGPWLYRLSHDGDPGPYRQELMAQELAARVECVARFDALAQILAATPVAASDVLLIKGISLCRRVYPEPHLRLMGDLDLLVPQPAQPLLEATLRELGYVQRSPQPAAFYDGHHHSMPFVHPQRRIHVEVHTGLLPPGNRLAALPMFQPEALFARRRLDAFREFSASRLADEVEFAYLAAHWLSERAFRGVAVIPIIDLGLLVTRARDTLDWERLLGALAGTAAGVCLRVALGFLHQRLDIALPAPVRVHLRQLAARPGPRVDRSLHHLIERHALRGVPFGPWRTAFNTGIVWEALLAPRPAWINFLSVPWRLLFPPGPARRYDLRAPWRRLLSVWSRRTRRAPQ
jgi:hypothetical protein